MVKGAAYGIFILPVVFTIVFSAAVMVGALDELDRELHMLDFSSEPSLSQNQSNDIEIIGLKNQYTTSEPVQVQVKITDESFDCGDLYITILSKSSVITQNGFFTQCFDNSGVLPIDEQFNHVVTDPGTYELTVEMRDSTLSNTIEASKKFTVN